MEDAAALEAARQARKEKIGRIGFAFVFPFLMVVMMITGYLGAMHDPRPNDMPIVVAGPAAAVEQFASALENADPDAVDIRLVDSADTARAMVIDREASGAVVLPAASPDEKAATVYTAGSAGASQASTVQGLVTPQLLAGGLQIQAQDLVPLPAEDSAGLAPMFLTTALILAGYMPLSLVLSSAPELLRLRRTVPILAVWSVWRPCWVGSSRVSLYLAIGWIMSGFLLLIVLAMAAPDLMRKRVLVPIMAGWSVFMSAVLWVIAGPIVGAIDGHFLPLFGVGVVAIFSAAMFTTVFTRMIGLLAVLPVVAVLMFLGVPSSGGGLSVYMAPDVFRFLHDVLPLPAAVESARSILYFGGDAIGSQLLTFAIWAAVSFIVVLVLDTFFARPPQPIPGRAVPPGVADDGGQVADAAEPASASPAGRT
ncbi:hypothetical protein CNO18_16745 [Gordonia sp. 1D]|nr:hypothetical protein CNO18_16745 [Gordonia sp. 1D]